MAKPTIAAGFAKALMDLAVSKGADQQELAARSGINPGDLADQDNRIALENYASLMEAGKELSGDPALALHFGEAFSMDELSIVGLIGQSSATVTDAFDQLNRYVRLMVDADQEIASEWFEILHDDSGVWMALTSDIYDNHPYLAESAFVRAVSRSSTGLAGKPFAQAVHFKFAPPAYSVEFDRVFNMPVVFGSDRYAFLIDETLLAMKLPHANAYAFGVLSKHADDLLKSLENAKTIKGKVERLLIPDLHTGDISMEMIADRMGLSRQTLYRKLKAEDLSYEKLLDNLRHQMALNYLNGKKVSVAETAYLVGFSDPSAFSRAFKRWTGKSPRAMRG